MTDSVPRATRRRFLLAGSAVAAVSATASLAATSLAPSALTAAGPAPIVTPPADKRILLSCKLGMIDKKTGDKDLSLVQRLRMAADAGLDGVDFDEAGEFTPAQVRDAVRESGVFVHNAINHAHWKQRLTSADEAEREQGRANIEHCIRVSHAAGGSGVLFVIGIGGDGPVEVIEERCRAQVLKLIPVAASLGQRILIENVWNKIHYDHDQPPEQTAERFVKFVDSFHSPWVGMYYDIGNHWKYGQPIEWLRTFGPRCVKLDIKGFSRKEDKFTEIDEGDLPWHEVRQGLAEIGFAGWATAEVRGGNVERLTTIRKQMQRVLLG